MDQLRNKQIMVVDTIRRLLHRNAWQHVNKIVAKLYPIDVAYAIRLLGDDEQLAFLTHLTDTDKVAESLSELSGLDHELAVLILTRLPEERAIDCLKAMSSDDSADLLATLPEDFAQRVLARMGSAESRELETLLSYPDDTAGGIMTTEFFALDEELTVAEAIGSIRKRGEEAETVFYIYVVDRRQHLVGIISLRQLILSQPDIRLRDIMNTNVVRASVTTDQELVAHQVEKYNLLAIPVVNDESRLVGIITVDDIIDVIRQEATEDIFRMAGTDSNEIVYADNLWKICRLRLPWLFTTLLGGITTGYFMWLFKATLGQVLALVTFIPVITGMGGNVGTQSASIIVRGLATGRIPMDNLGRLVWREARIGIILGLTCGLSVGVIAFSWHREWILGLVVAAAMSASMTIAAAMGALAPTVFHRLRIDPAIASGPFVTTSNDIIGILVYMGTATAILRFLHP